MTTTEKQKRKTYRRLWLICEVHGLPSWRLALERAGQKTGVAQKKKCRRRLQRFKAS